MDYRTKSLILSNYSWLENDIPIELTDKTIPEIAAENYENENVLLANLTKLDSLINNHPSIKVYDFKLQQLAIEKKFKKDKLKPNLNFNYNPLFDAKNLSSGFQNNYKWALVFGFPLL